MRRKDDVRKRAWEAIRYQPQDNRNREQLTNPSPTVIAVSENTSQCQPQSEISMDPIVPPSRNYLTLNTGLSHNDSIPFVEDTESNERTLEHDDVKKLLREIRQDINEIKQSQKVQELKIQESCEKVVKNTKEVSDIKGRLNFIYGKRIGKQ